jgi:NitT/TauT family transport system substrate-binding protein
MDSHGATRREFLRALAAGAVSALGTSFGAASAYSREKDETLRVGYLPITDATPLLIAHAMGYFQDEGLNVERPIMIRNWSALLEAFLTGKFNVTHMLIPIPVWMRFNNKVPVKVLAWDHINGSALTVSADSGIKGFADLGGKQIAVPYWYSIHNIILQMALRKVGLEPVIQDQSIPLNSRQTNLFILPPPDMPAALVGKKIDGYIVAEPFNAIGEMKVGARIMRFTGDIWKNHPCCVVVMNEMVSRSRPVFTQKVINAIVRAQLWTSNNLAEAANLLGREGMKYLPVSKKVLSRVFTGYDLSRYGKGAIPRAILHPEWGVGRIGFQPYPYPSATRLIVKEMGRTLMEGNSAFLRDLDPYLAARELVDDTFVKRAMEHVGGWGKFPAFSTENPWEREEVVEV